MNNAYTPLLGNGNSQAGLGHRIHSGGNQGQVQTDVSRELSRKRSVLGQDLGEGWHQQHIVEGERFT